jgi:hypothetical protein
LGNEKVVGRKSEKHAKSLSDFLTKFYFLKDFLNTFYFSFEKKYLSKFYVKYKRMTVMCSREEKISEEKRKKRKEK